MKLFSCDCCGNLLYFENTQCLRCGAVLGFLPDSLTITPLVPDRPGLFRRAVDDGRGRRYRQCRNYDEFDVCNWMVESESDDDFCLACRLNRTVPDPNVGNNRQLWYRLETEKRRLVLSLLQLGLPVVPRSQDPDGLAFDFLADPDEVSFSEKGRVMTGHDRGLITINLEEADPVLREKMRLKMAEPYRTILGHFRHESGHYYWDRLIAKSSRLEDFRACFGDERRDYGESLSQHYSVGPPADWAQYFISSYASCHPWEDWAETWAHYLHIIDTLETAHQFGLEIDPKIPVNDELRIVHDFNPFHQSSFQDLLQRWLPTSLALNSLNRSMGHSHVYPFVLTPLVVSKLSFVHRTIRGAVSRPVEGEGSVGGGGQFGTG